MTNLEIPTPRTGAAYQVLYERFSPANCNTRERQIEIIDECASISKWAKEQSVETMNAYLWAIEFMLKQVDASIKRNSLQIAVYNELKTIERPPNAPSQ